MTDPISLAPILAPEERPTPAVRRSRPDARGALRRVRRARPRRQEGRGARLDARRVPQQRPALRRDAREQRADGRPARARVDHARADAQAEAGADREGPGRGRPRAAAVPRRGGPRQVARADVPGPARRQDEVPQRLPLPDEVVGRRRHHRVARRRRGDRRPAGAARLELRAVQPDDEEDLLGRVRPHHARPRRGGDDDERHARCSATWSRRRSIDGGGR